MGSFFNGGAPSGWDQAISYGKNESGKVMEKASLTSKPEQGGAMPGKGSQETRDYKWSGNYRQAEGKFSDQRR